MVSPPSSPSLSSPKPTEHEVSPERPPKTDGFPHETINMIIDKINPNCSEDNRNELTNELLRLTKTIGANNFDDFQFFEWTDIKGTINTSTTRGHYQMLLRPLTERKMSYIFQLAKTDTPFAQDLTMSEIRCLIEQQRLNHPHHPNPQGT